MSTSKITMSPMAKNAICHRSIIELDILVAKGWTAVTVNAWPSCTGKELVAWAYENVTGRFYRSSLYRTWVFEKPEDASFFYLRWNNAHTK